MAWIYLVFAGVFEIGWPLGFKLASSHEKSAFLYIMLSILSMAMSGWLLFLAQKTIPIGTAYIVWTGIGGVGTALVGIVFFGDSISVVRLMCLSMIVFGVIGLKLFS